MEVESKVKNQTPKSQCLISAPNISVMNQHHGKSPGAGVMPQLGTQHRLKAVPLDGISIFILKVKPALCNGFGKKTPHQRVSDVHTKLTVFQGTVGTNSTSTGIFMATKQTDVSQTCIWQAHFSSARRTVKMSNQNGIFFGNLNFQYDRHFPWESNTANCFLFMIRSSKRKKKTN